MRTFLLTWNPNKWSWDSLGSDIEEFRRKGSFKDTWSCGNRKDLPEGSRVYLMKLGEEPRGLVASGRVVGEPERQLHWQDDLAAKGKEALYVEILFDVLERDPVLGLDDLADERLSAFDWTPQSSGVEIPEEVANVLERVWAGRAKTVPFSHRSEVGKADASDRYFRLKNSDDYVAIIQGGEQKRSRNHEKMVAAVAERLRARGAEVSTPHPIDVLMTSPLCVVFELKTVRDSHCLFAVREAVGQLAEYRHFVGPESAALCIVLDRRPEEEVIPYVEETLGLLLAWLDGEEVKTGPRTRGMLAPLLGGPIDTQAYAQDIRQSIRTILSTQPGERVLRPDFGCGLHDFVFYPTNPETLGLIECSVRQALTEFEPRIELLAVEVSGEEIENGLLVADIDYLVRDTQSRENLVFSFWLGEVRD